MKIKNILLATGVALLLSACAKLGNQMPDADALAEKAVSTSWQNMQPGWEKRLVQDATQKQCSLAKDKPAKEQADSIEKLNQSYKVVYPAGGKMMGDWAKGEALAQNGYGMRVGDNDPKRENGGNCYACHQIQKKELSFGTMGPSLLNFGKLRGTSEPIVKYTYDKIYNSQAFSACSNMPRYGHNAILNAEQISHLVALLLDPQSPVNQ